jgi:protein tyrosine/serine phosphatase
MRMVRVLLGVVIAGVLVSGPFYYLSYRRAHFRNFHVVRDGVLYRSGQLSAYGMRRAVFEYDIKTVVTLRFADRPGDPPPDIDEEFWCRSANINYVRIPYRPWWASDGSVPAEKGVQKFLEIMRDPANYPVLVHCFAGIHRTGAYCAIYRMEFDKWSNADAIKEMRHHGYVDEHPDVLAYLENYGHADAPCRAQIRPASHHDERKVMSK